MDTERDDFEVAADEIIKALRSIRVADGGQLDSILENLCQKANDLRQHRNWESSSQCCETAGGLAQDDDDAETRCYIEGCVQMHRGVIYLSRQEGTWACNCFEDAETKFRAGKFNRSRSVARMAAGLSLLLHGNLDQALRELRYSRELLRIQATDDATLELINCVETKLKEAQDRYLSSLSDHSPGAPSRGEELGSDQPRGTRPTEGSQQRREQPEPPDANLKQIPIVAIVRAGLDRLADQKQLGFLSLDADLTLSVTHAVVIEGHSMVEEGIYPGDFVLIHEQRTLDRGELGVFLITYAGELTETTLKRYHPEADHTCLKPMNENEPTALIIPRQEDASRIIKQYEQQGLTVHPYVNADLEIVAKAYGLFRLFDRVRRRGKQ